MVLTVDLESSDLLKRDLPLDSPDQPWIVSIAADLSTLDGISRDFFCTRVRSGGRKIKPEAEGVHGISSRAAGRSGVSEITALGMLCGFAAQATVLVGHNIEFDRDVIVSLLLRNGRDTGMLLRPGLTLACTMKAATPICRLPHDPPWDSGQFRWPSLDEACEIILKEPARAGFHSAFDDVGRCKRLYLELRDMGVLEAA
jgi:DNA polymerase III epsilon subunit-like protein